MQLTRDSGKSWSAVTPEETPEWAMVSLIEASPFDAGTAYVAVDAHKLDNFKPYIFKTNDFGKSWTKISPVCPTIPTFTPCAKIPNAKGFYAGTELESGFHSMMARTGKRFSSIYPSRRFTIW